jgi:hypothetical protein
MQSGVSYFLKELAENFVNIYQQNEPTLLISTLLKTTSILSCINCEEYSIANVNNGIVHILRNALGGGLILCYEFFLT